jgi:DNA polymerase-1
MENLGPETIARRGLFLALPFGERRGRFDPCDGLVLKALDGFELVLDLSDPAQLDRARSAVASPDRVFAIPKAQPVIGRLLASGIDVRRALCADTLVQLLGRERPFEQQAPRTLDAARERLGALGEELPGYIEEIGGHPHKKVARLECLAIPAFAALEFRGLPLDRAAWSALVDESRAKEKTARAALFDALGDAVPKDLFGEPDLNLDNDLDVKAVLEKLIGQELPSVGKGVLAGIDHPAARALLDFREHHKVVTTYGASFLENVDEDGRVRARFIPLGASTGRVASRDPNLQNLPSGDAFHRCVRAPEGRALVTADYATCELRILAELSGDPVFLEAFERGDDLHSRVASEIFGQPVSKTENPELRARAKAINFGLCYGMGAGALGASVGVGEEEGRKLLDDYFRAFPRIKGYLEASVDKALKAGFAQTRLGRRLKFSEEALRGENPRGELGRIAKNMPIQGTSADMTKLAMVRVHERLREGFSDAGLVNTVHDELVVECDEAEKDAVVEAVREEMSAAHSTLLRKVPPVVDAEASAYWTH